jgi:flagellar L-ring protein precursor FlgH
MQEGKMRKAWWLAVLMAVTVGATAKKEKAPKRSPLDEYVQQADQRAASLTKTGASPGSLWQPGARFGDLARDLRAAQVDDLVTIAITENSSASATGVTNTSRKSSTTNSIMSLLGVKSATGALANLATTSGDTELAGTGTTSRQTVLTATISAHVTHVLANGNLVVEGTKDVLINSERQLVTVRGVVRPDDLDPTNQVISDRVGQLEVRINGKGVVGDAIRRPNFLYRLLLGLLPF